MPRLLSGAFIACLLFLFTNSAFAQRDLGTITGTVTDASGAAIPNAKITIVEDATGLSYNTVTGDSGSYNRPALKPGTYTVTVEAAGFQKSAQKGVVVNPGEPTAVNIAIQVGNASQTVEVTASAPLLQTESPVIGANLNSAQVAELPLGGSRTFSYLARLSPGVLPAEQGARDSLGGGFSANGVRSTGENNFLLNGVDNNVNVIDFINQTSFVISPSVEAIGELQVLTNGYSAEYGRAAGGVVNAILKSGTNELHGVAFEILQNEKLNANRWENKFSGINRAPFKQNQFGGTLGGPIIKNKLFVFGDYQGTRIATAGGVIQNLGYGGLTTVPTQAMINGDFSALLGPVIGTDAKGNPIRQNQLYDPTTTQTLANGQLYRTPYLNNQIPISQMDPASRKIAALYPASNVAAGNVLGFQPQNNYAINTAGALQTDQGDARVDYRLSEKDSLFGSISWSNTYKNSVVPFAGALDGSDFNGANEQDLGRNAQIGYTRIWSPTIVSETRVAFSRLVTARTQANASTDEFKAFGIGGLDPTTSSNGGLPQIGLNHYRTVGAQNWLPTKEYNNVWDFIQNVAVTKGSHSYKFGAEYRPIRFPFFQVPYPHGDLNFSRNETANPSNANTGNTGDEFASFLLGAVNNGTISTTNFIASKKQAFAWYAQDDWKVTPKLTVNLGVRYELFSPIGEAFGRQSNFVLDNLTLYIPAGKDSLTPLPPNFSAPVTINGITSPALFPNVKVDRGSKDPYLIPWDKFDIGPRIGFAWNIRQKTVIRAAYGIFYGGEENQGGNPNRGESAPFNLSPDLSRPAGVGTFTADPYFANGAAIGGVSVGFPTNVFNGFPVSSLQFRSVATDFLNPMVQKWNLAVQQELPGQMALEVSYVGNHSSHQLLQPDPNACPNLGTANTTINCNALRPYPNIGGIQGTATFGFGNYAGMTAKLEKRMSKGLQFVSSYTYGHALANSGTTLSGSSGFYYKDPRNISGSYSNAAWDIRHNFTTGLSYDIPFGRGKQYGGNVNGFLNAIAGGWQMNSIITFHSGQPFTLRATGCQGVFSQGCSPDPVSGKDPNAAPANGRNPGQWFNTANVTAPAAFTEGALGLQTNYGPPTRSVDLSLFKTFDLTERFHLQFRAESFNIGNTPQFSLPDNTTTDAKFGQVTSTATGSERHVQFSLRLGF